MRVDADLLDFCPKYANGICVGDEAEDDDAQRDVSV